MSLKNILLYKKNHINKDDERLGLFQQLNDNYTIEKVLYSGNYAHITPTFTFLVIVFNDIYMKLQSFYNSEDIKEYINKRKFYSEKATFSYICADYNNQWSALPLITIRMN